MLLSFPFLTSAIALTAFAYGAAFDLQIHSGDAKAVYTMTNESPNQVVAFPVLSGHQLGPSQSFPTGGNGAVAVVTNGTQNFPDSLASSHSVLVYGNYLFNVNSGSNSISMFEISPSDPTSLQLVGVYNTPGDFPNSLAVHNDTICVGHSGTRTGVSCAKWKADNIGFFDGLRILPPHTNQTVPPNVSFDISVLTEIVFTWSGSSLVGMSTGNASMSQGVIGIWSVDSDGKVAQDGTLAAPIGMTIPFGADPVPGTSKLFVSDAMLGAFVIDVESPDSLLSKSKVEDKFATCWAQFYPRTGHGYVTDVQRNMISKVDLGTGAVLQAIEPLNSFDGYMDFRIVGDALYALAVQVDPHAHFITVFDLTSDIFDGQNVTIEGSNGHVQGLAVFV
ncbi:uncharacterized protein N7529_005450 [Penicillium soppii]|uniref:uncharacterized protein n=1 Tax=Penicillium soppii TaxID=69789 RepID=UPI002547ACBE|nr:uncharacterized protein N7529_005450 [Penicillium soppii]KAJ5863534.1 hypothetical protein N7529_005450 [Penicillium soppii]